MAKLIVLENDDWYWTGFEDFFKTISTDYQKLNPDVQGLFDSKNKSLWFAMTLSQPDVEHVAMTSSFQNIAYGVNEEGTELIKQMEFYIPILKQVMAFRKRMDFPSLTIHIAYRGSGDFLEDMKDGDLGIETANHFKMLCSQFNNFQIRIYDPNDYSLIKTMNPPGM